MATQLLGVRLEAPLKDQVIYDDEVDNWFLMTSWAPVTSIVAVYLAFVCYIGPQWMADRKPFVLTNIILAYNIIQAVFNAYIASHLFTTPGIFSYLYNHSCSPLPPKINPYNSRFTEASYLYFLAKTLDLLDTVFFVLKKKKSQITFLHVYHHSTMLPTSWIFLKFIRDESAIYIGFMNSVGHVILYSYYFLSALGPEVQKYLWWKRYITRLQLIQFLVFMAQQVCILIWNCDHSRPLTYFGLYQGTMMILMFLNFYYHSYIKTDKVALKNKVA